MSRRRIILTKEVLAGIPAKVEAGMNRREIAAELGCTVNTLTVQCSRNGISLRRGGPARGLAIETSATLLLTADTLRALRIKARAKGIGEVRLVANLVSIIVEDNLVDAVLDEQEAS